jgi:hypothetical protein
VVGAQVVGAIWYVEGASDALRIPLLYFDGAPTFPIVPAGGDVWIVGASGGALVSSI